MKRFTGAAMLLLIAGCATPQPVRDAASLDGPLPEMLVRLPPAEGSPEIMLLAGFGGTIDLSGDCVTVVMAHDGARQVPIFYTGTTIGRDSNGLYLRDRETADVFRSGDAFSGGGGFISQDILNEKRFYAASPGPACRNAAAGGVVSINPGMRHAP
ncbi:hypothetical protein [Croceicoccus bisphenolivorans]|uniref:hypothetical protein n=1 Tax=Croceicoccus bisphenolivorans TaxID=1783232 RepID=UPI00082D9657|nr:hypothetical protein [Croceicoccus bisphenolivorans]